MTEVIESLALNRSKAKLKLDSLKSSKDDIKVVVDYLESLINDYSLAIEILMAYQNKKPNSNNQTIQT